MRSLWFGLWAVPWLVWAAAPARAQVNTEALASGVRGPGPRLTLAASVDYAAGNVDFVEWRGDVAGGYATRHPGAPGEHFWFRDRVLLHLNGAQKYVSGAEVVNTGFAHGRYTRMQWLHVGGEVYGQVQFDKQRLLQWRSLLGAGLHLVAFNREHLGVWGGTGYMAEWEKRKAGVEPRRALNHRWSNYVTLQAGLAPERVQLVSTTYLQPRLDDFGDLQLLHESQLRFAITRALSFSTNVSVRHDSRPPRIEDGTRVERTDVRVGSALRLVLGGGGT